MAVFGRHSGDGNCHRSGDFKPGDLSNHRPKAEEKTGERVWEFPCMRGVGMREEV